MRDWDKWERERRLCRSGAKMDATVVFRSAGSRRERMLERLCDSRPDCLCVNALKWSSTVDRTPVLDSDDLRAHTRAHAAACTSHSGRRQLWVIDVERASDQSDTISATEYKPTGDETVSPLGQFFLKILSSLLKSVKNAAPPFPNHLSSRSSSTFHFNQSQIENSFINALLILAGIQKTQRK